MLRRGVRPGLIAPGVRFNEFSQRCAASERNRLEPTLKVDQCGYATLKAREPVFGQLQTIVGRHAVSFLRAMAARAHSQDMLQSAWPVSAVWPAMLAVASA